MAQIEGVILDVDGTLVDSNDAHARAWVQAMREQGHDVDYDEVRQLIGMGGDNLLPEALGIVKDTEEGERLSERRGEIFQERYFPRLKAFDKVEELLGRMSKEGLRLVVASSAQADELEDLLELAGASGMIEESTSSSDAERSKPDPDIVQAALDRLGLAAEKVIMIGDSPYDIRAAADCGVNVIAVRCGGFTDHQLADALAIYDDPADLLERYDDSPLARTNGQRG
jgi:HAD superfamily hydrolase (TIGR01509 family)